MGKRRVPENNEPGLQLLLAMKQVEDFNRLRELLHRGTNEPMHLDHVCSMQAAHSQLGQRDYHLLLCDFRPHDDAVMQWMQQTVAGNPSVPIVNLAEQGSDATSEAAIKRTVSLRSRMCDRLAPCLALSILNSIHTYRQEKQHRMSAVMLRKLKRAVEQSLDMVMITNSSGTIEYVNPAFEALTGYSSQEVTGQTLGLIKSEQQPGELHEEMWDTVLAGKVFRGVVMNRKKNGETLVVEKVLTPLLDAEGTITHFISTARDISDRRKLEAELQQVHKMDAIGRLAGGVAHDFNNLLMVISAYAELMQDSLATEHPLRRNVTEIITASRRAAGLTAQLLAFGRKQVQSLQVLDLNTVIEEVSRMLGRLIGEDIELLFVPGQNLGRVRVDPVQIEQVLMNLAANARDAMPRGGKLTIETANMLLDAPYRQHRPIVPPGDYVLLAVTDSGEGIARENLANIFEPFFTTKEAGKGTGLGLATVYGIVKQSKGFIWVYSEPGLGTTFKIYLPRVMRKSKPLPANTQPAVNSTHGWETVLLVEDEAALRQSSREFLVRTGYTVVEATDGEDALRAAREYAGPIHLLITDVVMPKVGGPQLAEQLKLERPQIQVLFVSGYAENTVLRHGKIDTATRFLQKPFSLAALATRMRQLLDANQPIAAVAAPGV